MDDKVSGWLLIKVGRRVLTRHNAMYGHTHYTGNWAALCACTNC